MAATIQPCWPPVTVGSGGRSASSPDRLAGIGRLLAQTDLWLAGDRVIPDQPVSRSDPDAHPIGQGKRPSPSAACRRHQLERGNANQFDRTSAQTAYCSGAAMKCWWHTSEQK
jgi:hypothetical protein